MTFQIPAAMEPTESTDIPSESALPLEASLDQALLSQTVLRLAAPEALYGNGQSVSPSSETAVPVDSTVPMASTQVLEAMQRLVKVITNLRSPTSGWSSETPKTPETFAPYVVEEAYDVLEALQKNYFDPPQSAAAEVTKEVSRWQSYFLISDLAPWLLWCAARSSPEVMRLLEGVPAKVFKLGQGWRTGILRLVAAFKIEIPELSAAVDLATFQVAEALLSSDTMIQSDQCSLCCQPVWIAGFLPNLIEQIQSTTPAVDPFFASTQVDVLTPKRNWQSGTVQLQLGFEFIPTDTTAFPDSSVDVDERASQEMGERAIATPSTASSTAPMIKFTDSAWLEKYSATLLQQHLTSVVQQLPTFRAAGEKNRNLSSQSLIPLIVKDACNLTDLLQSSPLLSSHAALQQEISLDTLTYQLLWSFSRSAYESMQLIGGIRVNLLQPECDWETGILRLLASLTSKTPEQDWNLDVATRQPLQPSIFPLANSRPANTAIVQSNESRWCEQPNVLEQVKAKLMQQLEQVAPELLLLMAGTDVDVLSDNQQWHSGAIQLSVDFEFIPDLSHS